MKKFMYLLLLFVSSIILISSCKKDEPPPIASFLMDKTNGLVPCTILFTNQSTNANSYKWNFGDGTESTLQNVSHIYTSSGDFAVTLTATGEGGTNSTSQNVNIRPSLTGEWDKMFNLLGTRYDGTMNIDHNEDNKLTGDFMFNDGSGYTPLLYTSKISGSSVTIDWMLDIYKLSFKGTVNNNFTYMSGSYYVNGQYADTWSASKSSKKKALIMKNDFSNSNKNNLLQYLLKTTIP